MKSIAIIMLALASAIPVVAQENSSARAQPKTQLEAFAAETGAVIIKGYSDIGKVVGMGSVEVDCREFTNAKSGKKGYGIVIQVTASDRLEREASSYIDYEEIDSLIAGIDYISKITPAVTKLRNFEATYATKGDFSITVFNNSNGKLAVAVNSGYVGRTSAYLGLEKLPELRGILVRAKQQLDAIQK